MYVFFTANDLCPSEFCHCHVGLHQRTYVLWSIVVAEKNEKRYGSYGILDEKTIYLCKGWPKNRRQGPPVFFVFFYKER